jgi:hypothetical protein
MNTVLKSLFMNINGCKVNAASLEWAKKQASKTKLSQRIYVDTKKGFAGPQMVITPLGECCGPFVPEDALEVQTHIDEKELNNRRKAEKHYLERKNKKAQSPIESFRTISKMIVTKMH